MSNNSKCGSCGTPTEPTPAATAEFIPTVTQTTDDCGACAQTHTYEKDCSSSCPAPTEMPTPTCPTSDSSCCGRDLFAKTASVFTYPASGQSSQVKITNVKLTEGQPLSSEKYGVLYVFSILDEASGVYELENRGDTDESLVGKQVPCGTEFWTEASGLGSSSSSSSCTELTKDFRIPAVGLTAVAEVSSLAEFQVSSPAIIRLKANSAIAYRYTVISTSGVNQLELRNDGQGGPVGTFLSADQDTDGLNDWCVEALEGGSLCEQASDSSGLDYVLGCDGSVTPLKIEGTTDKHVLAWDQASGQWKLFLLPDVQACVNLLTCFQVVPQVGCKPTPAIVTTSDDQLLLDRATEALLSPNANPLVTVCGDDFQLDLGASSVGNIVLIPSFDPASAQSYDENCQICVPPDCCSQCDPQIEPPIDGYTFTGKFIGGSMELPTGIMAAAGNQEYKFRVVWDPASAQLLVNQYDSSTNAYIQSYNSAGAVFVPSTSADDLRLDIAEYCNDTPCPLLLTHGVDTTFDFLGLNADAEVSFNYHSLIEVFDCADLVTPLSATQHQIVQPIRGATRTSLSSTGEDRFWGVPTPANKSFSASSGESERSIAVLPGQCFRATAELTLLVYVDTTINNATFINFNSNIRVASQII